jgi:hypothetical protein
VPANDAPFAMPPHVTWYRGGDRVALTPRSSLVAAVAAVQGPAVFPAVGLPARLLAAPTDQYQSHAT